MDDFLKTDVGFGVTLRLIETVNRSTDDFLFIWDIAADRRWFFGDIDRFYDIRNTGSGTNSTSEMMRIVHPADRKAVLKSLDRIAKGEKDTHNMDYRWINRQGNVVWINCHGTVIRDGNGTPYLMIGRVSEEKLRHLYNPLTSLWNKNKLRADLKEWLKKGQAYLMLLDVDDLAAINLSHGRDYGDRLLKEIAEGCENAQTVATAYHVDHNYFALIVEAQEEGVRRVYATLGEHFCDKCTFTAGAVPISRELFYNESQLLDSVNMTLKKAKKNSRNRLEFFSAEDLSEKIASLALLEELTKSAENGFEGFELLYQPQLRAGTYDLYGVEALLRYRSASRGRVFPDEFIPLLEQSRLIKPVGIWVLGQALEQCKRWREKLPELRISVNFSATQFEDPFLAEKVICEIQRVGLPGDALTVELTESVELRNDKLAIADTIKHLKEFRVNFAIDDFGTGYSNLSYLKRLNVDEIKIDRTFVSGIEQDSYNHKLVSNVIEFAKGNAIRTCCEGVENPEELATLELLFPDIIQGYLFERPNTADAIERSYVDSSASEYRNRLSFLQKLSEFKEGEGTVFLDPKRILRENEVGLWRLRIDRESGQRELYTDEAMTELAAMDKDLSSKERYAYWEARISSEDQEAVLEGVRLMATQERAVHLEYNWWHPLYGPVRVRFNGKRLGEAMGSVVIEGYCKMITDDPV